MSVTPNFVPRDFKTINILLTVNNAERALRFYNNAFGAEITEKLVDPEGLVRYAEMKIEDMTIMLSEDKNFAGASGVTFKIYTGDAEGLYESVVMAGAEEKSKIEPMLFGDRGGKVLDPFGYEWIIATHMEDVSASELHRRFDKQFAVNS